ncbi:MAG TPA: SgcJ/EcaC family oxidoreductase [Candidatus Polarisedimenticolia bacterium]|nr:SgcJ/EcaC family oxidoreductase [Candidatus Polarisedimenticolia bacterium]
MPVLVRAAAILLLLPLLPGVTASVGAEAPAPPAPAPSLPTVTLPAPLARVLTDYETAWRARDAKALAALFTEDGFVLSSASPPVRGRHEIEKHYQGAGGPLALRAFAYGTDGSLGWIVGGFAREAGQPDSGKFTLTLRKGPDGRWLTNSDMDNGNRRPS